MRFKQERWDGADRQELVKEVKPVEKEAVDEQQELAVPMDKDVMDEERLFSLVGDTGVEVIVVADDPRAAIQCLAAYHRAKVWGIRYRLTVVNNGGEEFLTCGLISLAQKHGFNLLVGKDPGQLPGLCDALAQSKAGWFVVLSQHTRVYDGWLNHLLAVADEKTAMVTACSNRIVPIPEGFGAAALADSFSTTLVDRGSIIPFPRECCLLINRKALDDCGGLDLEYYRPGGGQFLDFYLRAHEQGYLVKLAERCWVHDTLADYRGSATWEPQSRHGFYRFLSRHGKKAVQIHQDHYQKIDFPQSIAAQLLPSSGIRRDVVFVFREAVVCGLVLAVAEICNGLNRMGRWNAYFSCTRFDEVERKRVPMNFAPVVHESEVMQRRWLTEKRGSILVATLWNTAEQLHQAGADPSCSRLYFIQDDERRFRHANGAPYVEPEKVTASWRLFVNLVVNSSWVQKELQKEGLQAKRIGIGVDTARFYPREKDERPLRVMVHCRPSTPRRGWPFICAVLNRAARSMDFELVTYDEAPVDLEVSNHGHLGKVSPDELAAQMGKADIFFEGSEFQGWGMQALEAMASGCALITTCNEGVQEFATAGYDCVMVEHGEVEVSASVLCHLLRDNFERHVMQERARSSAMAFDWAAICRAWDEHLRQLLN